MKFKMFSSAALVCTILLTGCKTDSTMLTPELLLTEPTTQAPPKPEPQCPVDVRFLSKKRTSSHCDYLFELKITNPTNKPRWFIFRQDADRPLREDEIFSSSAPNLLPFASYRLNSSESGGKGEITRVLYKGANSFIAFRLLPRATILLHKFHQFALGKYKEFEVWQASDILVNSKTPLEEWLPYNVMSTKEAVITDKVDEVPLDLNHNRTRQRTDYPKEKIMHVWVQREHQWSMPAPTR